MTGRPSFLLRALPLDIDPGALGIIDAKLAAIAGEEQVTLALAIESGSRAWGFPSPDSDYDVRFIYARRSADYLSPWQKNDVIERPIDGDFDINGWDLAKALRLLVKGNAVVIEWMMSPIIYVGDAAFRDELKAFAVAHVNRVGVARHYLHLGERQRQTYFADGKSVHLKKIFYALRPAAALRWLRLHPAAPIAPMHFPTLMHGCDAPAEVQRITADLIARKAVTRELGAAPLPAAIERFIDEEFATARATLPDNPFHISPEARIAADTFFRRSIATFDRLGGSTSLFSAIRKDI